MTYEKNLVPLGSVCAKCGTIVDRGSRICDDCFNDTDKGGANYSHVSDLPNWCRLRDCDYDCHNCEARFIAENVNTNTSQELNEYR